MIINYKMLNHYIKFDEYYLSNKKVFFNLTRNNKIYSKFDQLSRFQKIEMDKDSIEYTAFSTPLD